MSVHLLGEVLILLETGEILGADVNKSFKIEPFKLAYSSMK